MGGPISASTDDLFARARAGDQGAWRELFARARDGDQAAWDEIVATCNPKMLRVIRKRLNKAALRSLYDSTDFLGEVWESVAAKTERYNYSTLDDLQAVLATSAKHKVIDKYRKHKTEKYDIDRDRPLAAWKGGDPQVPSHDPTASQLAQEHETRERLVAGQPEVVRCIIDLKTAGDSNGDVVKKTGLKLRTVQRILQALGDSWRRGAGAEALP